MQLFYNETLTKKDTEIIFDKEESRHIIKSLRKSEGDTLKITNGKGELFTAEIQIANAKKCISKIISVYFHEKSWDYNLHIAIAPTKNNDRLEWFIEKATEIGIDEITPIICHNSERKSVKTERLDKISITAMKQSLKFYKTKINQPIKFTELIPNIPKENSYIAHCKDNYKKSLKNIPIHDSYFICIGPEGDFSETEIQLALEKMTPITLGKSRLRTETAGIIAVHSIAYKNEINI